MSNALDRWTDSPLAPLLRPASWIYGWEASRRFARAKAAHVRAPVICIGNPTVGGTGKTPTAMAVARTAREMGRTPGFVTRGFGRTARMAEPITVDPERHTAAQVGDEPLLLAEVAPTFVAKDRSGAARQAIANGCDLIVMDDGFQSRTVLPDEAALLIDRAKGIGNGRVLPAGPLRMPFSKQLVAADTLITIDSGGPSVSSELTRAAARGGLHVVRGLSEIVGAERWRGRSIVAFCGLGDPSKFTRQLETGGANIVAQWNFEDHHAYTERDVRALAHLADEKGGTLVTTAKDAVKLRALKTPLDYEIAELRLDFDPGALEGMVRRAVEGYAKRR